MGEYRRRRAAGAQWGRQVRVQDIAPKAQSGLFATARDGTRLAYRLRGAGQDGAVLIHSLAMTGEFWAPVADKIAKQMPVLTYDCRGHRRSDKPPGPYTVELFARDLADLLDQVGWRSALVAGASMGGCISLAFAAAYPARTAALGLIDTTAWYGADAPRQWAERAAKAAKDGMAALVEFQTTRWFGDKFRAEHPEIVAESIAVFTKNNVEAYVETCRMLGAADLRAALPDFAMPTAIVVGDEDYATPVAMSQALHQAIKGSTLTVLKGARHLTPLEAPDRIADELLALAARRTGR